MHRAYIENYIKYIHIAPFCSMPSAWLFASFCIEIEKKKSQAVFTDNHMNIDKKNHPQLLWQEQPFIWPMVIQIGLGKGMYVSTFSVLFRFGIFVSLICIPFQFLCTFHFVSFRYISLRFISFRFVLVNFVPFRYVSFPVSFRILQVPQFTRVQTPEAFDTISI